MAQAMQEGTFASHRSTYTLWHPSWSIIVPGQHHGVLMMRPWHGDQLTTDAATAFTLTSAAMGSSRHSCPVVYALLYVIHGVCLAVCVEGWI